MNDFSYRQQINEYVEGAYGIEPDFPFEKDFETAVLRECVSGKWFAIIMNVCGRVIGLGTDEKVEIINLKAPPEHIAQLVDNVCYLPAYHMNKKHWYTIRLDGSVPFEEICVRIDVSYDLIKHKKK